MFSRVQLCGLVLAAVFFSSLSQAEEMRLLCLKETNLNDCAIKTEKALAAIGCSLQASLTKCEYSVQPDPNSKDPDARIRGDSSFCSVTSQNCSQPRQVIFEGDTCGSQRMISIPANAGVSNPYYYGFLENYSRNICIAN